MPLLEEIQKETVDSNSDLGALLRKCKILASRLGSRPFEDWLIWESNGYPKKINVPNYRIWPLSIKGDFLGPFGSSIHNLEVPIYLWPKNIKDLYLKYECRQSIGSMEQMLKENKSSYLIVETGDLVLNLSDKVIEGYTCIRSWAEFGTGCIYELFNNVRNRILDFSIELWKVDPKAGDTPETIPPSLQPSSVTKIFYTTIYGGSANLIETADNVVINIDVHQGDVKSLENALRENKVSQEDIDNLLNAIKEEPHPNDENRFGPKVSNWISKMIKKAAEGTWAITLDVASRLLYQIIINYYGW